MPKYTDTSQEVFTRALDGLEDDVPKSLAERLRQLLDEERLHDVEAIRALVENVAGVETDDGD